MTSPAQPAPDVPESRKTVLGTMRAVLVSRRAWLVAALLVTALSMRAFAFDGFRMDGPYMAPTLAFGDHLLVHKGAYGWLEHRAPARGDVVVFRSPESPREDMASRVIGLSGDTILLQQGIVYINGWRVPSCLAGLAKLDVDGKEHAGVVLVELLGDTAYLVFHDDAGRGHEHAHGDDQAHGHAHESGGAPSNEAKGHSHGLGAGGPYTVPYNEVFVLGDNRENSEDSRAWSDAHGKGVGIDQIKGRATFVWMSFGAAGRADTSRIGVSVTGAPRCPKGFSPETCTGIEKCLANRPPREATTPPARKAIAPSP